MQDTAVEDARDARIAAVAACLAPMLVCVDVQQCDAVCAVLARALGMPRPLDELARGSSTRCGHTLVPGTRADSDWTCLVVFDDELVHVFVTDVARAARAYTVLLRAVRRYPRVFADSRLPLLLRRAALCCGHADPVLVHDTDAQMLLRTTTVECAAAAAHMCARDRHAELKAAERRIKKVAWAERAREARRRAGGGGAAVVLSRHQQEDARILGEAAGARINDALSLNVHFDVRVPRGVDRRRREFRELPLNGMVLPPGHVRERERDPGECTVAMRIAAMELVREPVLHAHRLSPPHRRRLCFQVYLYASYLVHHHGAQAAAAAAALGGAALPDVEPAHSDEERQQQAGRLQEVLGALDAFAAVAAADASWSLPLESVRDLFEDGLHAAMWPAARARLPVIALRVADYACYLGHASLASCGTDEAASFVQGCYAYALFGEMLFEQHYPAVLARDTALQAIRLCEQLHGCESVLQLYHRPHLDKGAVRTIAVAGPLISRCYLTPVAVCCGNDIAPRTRLQAAELRAMTRHSGTAIVTLHFARLSAFQVRGGLPAAWRCAVLDDDNGGDGCYAVLHARDADTLTRHHVLRARARAAVRAGRRDEALLLDVVRALDGTGDALDAGLCAAAALLGVRGVREARFADPLRARARLDQVVRLMLDEHRIDTGRPDAVLADALDLTAREEADETLPCTGVLGMYKTLAVALTPRAHWVWARRGVNAMPSNGVEEAARAIMQAAERAADDDRGFAQETLAGARHRVLLLRQEAARKVRADGREAVPGVRERHFALHLALLDDALLADHNKPAPDRARMCTSVACAVGRCVKLPDATSGQWARWQVGHAEREYADALPPPTPVPANFAGLLCCMFAGSVKLAAAPPRKKHGLDAARLIDRRAAARLYARIGEQMAPEPQQMQAALRAAPYARSVHEVAALRYAPGVSDAAAQHRNAARGAESAANKRALAVHHSVIFPAARKHAAGMRRYGDAYPGSVDAATRLDHFNARRHARDAQGDDGLQRADESDEDDADDAGDSESE